MSILSSLQVYAGKWNLIGTAKFDESDKASIKSATVVNSQYGKSVCFFLVGGGTAYMPMSNQGTQLEVGDVVDIDKCTVETLHRDGSADIQRCRID